MAAFPVVLVVEDDPSSLQTRVDLLQSHDFVVFTATNEASAIRQVHSVPSVDLIITDINLNPKSDADKGGLSLARRVREEHATIPIVGYSAHFEDLAPADKKAFTAYLEKGRSSI